jgi:hypothetical protein
MDFKHVVVTRFNLRHEQWLKKITKRGTTMVEWLERRFEIFHRFTLPSMMNQSCKRFDWVVLFDTETPVKFKQVIAEIKA